MVLIGNHEVMNMAGDLRDVTPEIYATFADEGSAQRREAAYEAYLNSARPERRCFNVHPRVCSSRARINGWLRIPRDTRVP